MHELICNDGWFAIQINNEGREFGNKISHNLHEMVGIRQQITSGYHPQSSGLVERQHRTTKNALAKILDENSDQWPYILEGVLFVHRVSHHLATEHLPFYLVHNQESVSPADLKYGRNSEPAELSELFDQYMFEFILSTTNAMRDEIHEATGTNIEKARAKQKRDFDRRHLSSSTVSFENGVLLKNNRRNDKKDAKFSYH